MAVSLAIGPSLQRTSMEFVNDAGAPVTSTVLIAFVSCSLLASLWNIFLWGV